MKKVNIGIIGLGTIGSGVYKILKQRRNRIRQLYKIDIQVLKCCDISDSTKRKLKIPSSNFTKDFKSIIQDERIDTVIELIGGTSVAYLISKEVLKSGKNLITANKALLAKYGDTLESLAGKHKKNIGYEASVGGGIPLINTIENSLLINEINSFQGIMNGTCNYILSLMANGTEFKDVLLSVQAIDRTGKVLTIPSSSINFEYRGNDLSKDLIFLSASFKGEHKNKDIVKKDIETLKLKKEETQPMRVKTGGSTFKNPIKKTDKKVWELIRASVPENTSFGDAAISTKHSNFFVNKNDATFNDMKKLIDFVKHEVKEKTGINLDLEIEIVG